MKKWGFEVGDGICLLNVNMCGDGTEWKPGRPYLSCGKVTSVEATNTSVNVGFVNDGGQEDSLYLNTDMVVNTDNPFFFALKDTCPRQVYKGWSHPVLAVTRTPGEILK